LSLPKEVREEVRARLWKHAEELDWSALSSNEKSRHYTQWSDGEAIGGVLSRYMNARAVRVYIKDTLLKGFGREKLVGHQAQVLRLVGRPAEDIVETFIKPHGLVLTGGLSVVWGRADDWKMLLGSLFERGHGASAASVVVLFRAAPRFTGLESRAMVEEAARRLGIERCVWFD
jgi:hypothetical protein